MSQSSPANTAVNITSLDEYRQQKNWRSQAANPEFVSAHQYVNAKLMAARKPVMHVAPKKSDTASKPEGASGAREKIMAEPTREEIVARIEASEARVEARLTGLDGKLDRLFDRVEVAITEANRAGGLAEDARKAALSTKWNILFTALGVVAVLVAAFALWAQGVEMVSGILGALPNK